MSTMIVTSKQGLRCCMPGFAHWNDMWHALMSNARKAKAELSTLITAIKEW